MKNSFHSKKESSAGPPPVVMGNFVRYYFSDSTFWNQWTDLVPFICVNDISDLPIFQILIWNLVFGYLVDWKLGGLANQAEIGISSCFYQNPNVQPGIGNLLNILNIWCLSFWGQRYSKNMGAIQNSCTIYSTIGCFNLCDFFLSAINNPDSSNEAQVVACTTSATTKEVHRIAADHGLWKWTNQLHQKFQVFQVPNWRNPAPRKATF